MKPQAFELRTQRLEPLPLVNHYLDRLGLAGLLERLVPTPDRRTRPLYHAGLGMALRSILYFVPLLITALLERDLRRAMVREKIEELPLYPEEPKTKRPTAEQVLRLFSLLERHQLHQAGRKVEVFSPKLTELQIQVLTLLGVPLWAYH